MVSIITPVLNGGKFIRKNIEAIKKLNIPFEHIIVDGGSDDETLAIVNEYTHIKLVNQEGKEGMYQAIHQGFTLAQGDYICWINCDDQLVPFGFEKMYHKISSNKELNFVYGDSILFWIKENRKMLRKGILFAKFLLNSGRLPFTQPSSIYSKELYNKIGGLNYKTFRLLGDKDLFMRMSLDSSFNISYVPYVTSIFTKHVDSLMALNKARYLEELKICPNNQNPIYTLVYHGSRVFQNVFGGIIGILKPVENKLYD